MSDRWHDTGAAAAYVAAEMTPDEVDAFEQHMLECADCRAQIVAGAAAIAELRLARVRERRRVPVGRLAAATVAFVTIAAVAWREVERMRLSRVVPPPFIGAAVRSTARSAGALADAGMQAYAAGDYAGAAAALAGAARTDSSPGVLFYLGVSLLKNGNAADAVPPLLRARVPDGNPFAVDATLFAAKALVRLRQPDSAMTVLTAALAAHPQPEALRAFADSIRR